MTTVPNPPAASPPSTNPLAAFAAATRAWFSGTFEAPTPAQEAAWRAVSADEHALVVAPTGSGKTLAAFLWSIDRMLTTAPADAAHRCRVVYVSPLKALVADVERNLRAPLAGIAHAAARAGEPVRDVQIAARTGDTPAADRRRFATRPADILVTTPESLFLVLTSAARSGLAGVETVIVDEIHAVAGTKRGAHLALTLERLDALLTGEGRRPAQRIGLSATVRPVQTVASFLAGTRRPADGGRPVRIVQPPADKRMQIDVAVPVPDLTDPASAGPAASTGQTIEPARGASIWPHVEERVVDLVAAHRSTLVFTNSRRGAERLTARMNELWAARQGEPAPDPGALQPALAPGQSGTATGAETTIARAHHGSMSRAERTRTETELKEGLLPAVVSTSSLELGIDMGSVDLVIQVGAPPSVASGLQRVGRAGHQVGAVSHGVVLPTHRGDLVPSAVIAERMRAGALEELRLTVNPLDVLAQQIVAMVAMEPWQVDELSALVHRAAPFARLGDGALEAVLDMLAGRYPSEDFGELRARIVWDRVSGTLTGRPGGLRLAVTSGGTIPDRGMYGVFLATEATGAPIAADAAPRGGRRVGELDEEMVYESRVGDTFTLGSSTWRIEDITHDRVLVSPAPGLPGRLPFWKGDNPGRPAELGKAIGAWVREMDRGAVQDEAGARERLQASGLDGFATDNLLGYLADQRAATGRVPDDRTILVERFRDELGDWRVVIHSPYGARVHAPWALILSGALRDRYGMDVAAMHSDDGIVLRLPDVGEEWGEVTTASVAAEDLVVAPDEVLATVRAELAGSVLFAARFREAAARALLLPRRTPGRRQPLWQQRQRSAQLLSVAAEYPDFPITLEAARECLRDDFDVAALTALMADLAAGRVRLVEVTTQTPSPFAQSLLFGYTAQFLYDGDAPLAERRAAALSLDPALLAELLDAETAGTQMADLLDPAVVERTEAELGALTADRGARDAEALWDVLRRQGPLTVDELAERTRSAVRDQVPAWLDGLADARRVIQVRLAGVPAERAVQWAVVEDAARLRDGLGAALPRGVADVFTMPVPDPLGDLVRRHARTHGPFASRMVADRFGLPIAAVEQALGRLEEAGHVVRGRLRPEVLGGHGDEWCEADVLRLLRRRSLAALRAEVEPVPGAALGVFLPKWQGVGTLRGTEGLLRAVEQLAGAAIPASALETLVLPSRVSDYSPAMLDELTTAGEVLWCGHSRLPGAGDGMVSLHLSEWAALTLPEPGEVPDDPLHRRLTELLEGSGGWFLDRLAAAVDAPADSVVEALWDLVWSGRVTNDSLATLRDRLGPRGGAHRTPRPPARPRPLRRTALGPLGGLRSGYRTGGRWSALPERDADRTRRTHALARVLLDRHGVLTRAIAPAEGVTGYFRGVYRVLTELEAAGAVRRGYFVEHLGGAQFALPGAVDRLREVDRREEAGPALVLAATDPANPYGAALPWPQPATGHRPGRKAGAVVVLVDGELALFVERGGRSVLSFAEGDALTRASHCLAEATAAGRLGRMSVRHIDGAPALTAAGEGVQAASALVEAGFRPSPSGLRGPGR